MPSPRIPPLQRKPFRGKASPRTNAAPIDDAFRDEETGLVSLSNAPKLGSSKLALEGTTPETESGSIKSSHTQIAKSDESDRDGQTQVPTTAGSINEGEPVMNEQHAVDLAGTASPPSEVPLVESENAAVQSVSSVENLTKPAPTKGSTDSLQKVGDKAIDPKLEAARGSKGSMDSLKKSTVKNASEPKKEKDSRKSYMLGFFGKGKGSKEEKEPAKKKDLKSMVKISSPTLIGPPPALSVTGTPIANSAANPLPEQGGPVTVGSASPKSIRSTPRELGSTFKPQITLDSLSKQVEQLNSKIEQLQADFFELKAENIQLKGRLDSMNA